MRRRISRTLLAAALVGVPLLGTALPVRAQNKSFGEVAAEARELFAQARVHHENKDWERARELYQASFGRIQNHVTATRLGHVETELQRYADAARHLTFALWMGPMETNDEIERERERLRAELRRIAPKIGHLQFELDGPAYVHSVTIDGAPHDFQNERWGVYVGPGEHRVVVTYLGAKPIVRAITVGKGETLTLKFTRPEPEFEPPRGMNVWGGGVAPPPKEDTHSPKFKSTEHLVVVATGAGLMLAGFGVGIFATVKANGTQYDREILSSALAEESASSNPCSGSIPADRQARCSELRDLDRQLQTEQTIGTIGLVTGGVFALGTVVAAVFWPDGDKKRTSSTRGTQIAVTPSRSGATWSLGGRF